MNHNICPQCGLPLEDDRPCPACLLEFAAETDIFSVSSPLPELEIELVEKAFPQLEIVEIAGRGGMGTVFKARQPKLDRFVALKILPENRARHPSFAERFAREGKLLARLSHPNIVAVYDFGQTEISVPGEEEPLTFFYLIMEFVDGVDLRHAMREERFTAEQTLAIVPKICDALQYAHEEGVLHRDIKPENILLDTKGRIKIADFGIASASIRTSDSAFLSASQPAGTDPRLTQLGQIVGTPNYMAPEQFEGTDRVDARADIYSLGVVFYELLTGELPKGDFPKPSEKTPVDSEIDNIVQKALDKNRERRYQSVEEFKTDVCVLVGLDETMNMMSIFAFIMVLGILVDDGIIIGENIYHHREQGKDFVRAAVDGTSEVAPSVVSSVLTTCIAFVPLLFLPGMVGKFTAIVPTVVIVTLLFSLFDSLFLLPVHLSHENDGHEKKNSHSGPIRRGVNRLLRFFCYPFSRIYAFSRCCNEIVDRKTQGFIERIYSPVLCFFLRRPLLFLSLMACVLFLAMGVVLSGYVKFTAFPEEDSFIVYADLVFPDGTPAAETMKAVQKIESAIEAIDRESIAAQHGKIRDVVLSSVGNIDEDSPLGGSNMGRVMVCLTQLSERKTPSREILNDWRRRVGEIPGVESLKFEGFDGSPGGEMVEFKLLAAPEDMPALENAVEEVKRKLRSYDGINDVASDLRPGKFEYQIAVKENALALGITNSELLDRIRPAYYGEEVMRLQRGRHEVKLMVRYPEEERNQLGAFDEIKYRLDADGYHRSGDREGEVGEIPMGELAEVEIKRGYSAINRFGQLRAVTVTASADSRKVDVTKIVEELRTGFVPEMLAKPEYRNIDVRWEGQFESAEETLSILGFGCLAAFLVIFTLLTFQFKSYFQPLVIMFIIPLSLVGAVFGHYVMGLDLTLMSFLGLVALAGVVTNDSIVLVDCANRLLKEGMPLQEVLLACGKRRFRAVFLTSITTIGGISPLMFENSFHTQALVPLAVSLSFGLMFSTVLVLLMIPVLLSLLYPEDGNGGKQ